MTYVYSMAQIIDIIRRVATNPDAKVRDILSAEDFECMSRCVSGITLPASVEAAPPPKPVTPVRKPVIIIRKPTKV